MAAALSLPASARAAESLPTERALAELKAGNAAYRLHTQTRFADGGPPGKPQAVILACSDCRFEPEVLFDTRGTSDLFVVRNAGALLDAGSLVSAEYGVGVLQAPLLIVLAHTDCVVTKAACEFLAKPTEFPGSVGRLIHLIVPAAMAAQPVDGVFAVNAAKESARQTAGRLQRVSSLIAERVKLKQLMVLTALLDDGSGEIAFFE